MNMQEWRRQRTAKLANPGMLVPPATDESTSRVASPQERPARPISEPSPEQKWHQNGTELAPFSGATEATQVEAQPTEIDRLVGFYLATFRRVGYLQGNELTEATERLQRLARKINQLDHNFDWPAIWRQEGVTPDVDPLADWPEEAREAIAWLESLDVATVPPFLIDPGWPVPFPVDFFARLRQGVAQGPGGPHAKQVARDVVRVMVAAKAAIASGRRPTPAQIIHGDTPTTRAQASREWDAEMTHRIKWLDGISVPAEPFRLDAQRLVSDPARFIERLRQEVAEGPNGPRARTGVLQADIEALERVLSPIGDKGGEA